MAQTRRKPVEHHVHTLAYLGLAVGGAKAAGEFNFIVVAPKIPPSRLQLAGRVAL